LKLSQYLSKLDHFPLRTTNIYDSDLIVELGNFKENNSVTYDLCIQNQNCKTIAELMTIFVAKVDVIHTLQIKINTMGTFLISTSLESFTSQG